MKKALIIFIFLIIIAIAIAPLLFGSKTEEAYHQITDQLSTGERIKLERGKYNKGFLESSGTSVATVIWDVPTQQNSTIKKAEPVSFKINHHILHGPFPEIRQGNLRPAQAMITTTLDPSTKTKQALGDLFPNGNPVTIKTWITLEGNSRSIISAAGIKKQSNDKGELEWHGLTGEINYDDRDKRFTTELELPLFSFTDNTGLEIRIKNMRFHSDLLAAGATSLVVGDLELSLDELMFHTLDQMSATHGFRIGDIALSTASRILNNQYHTTVDLQIQDLFVRQRQYGPVMYDVSLKQLDIDALDRVRREMHAVQNSNIPVEQQRIIAGGKFLSLLPTLLKSSPVLDINQISFYFEDEQFRISANVSVNNEHKFNSKAPLAFLTVLDTQADITIPKQMLAALPKPKSRITSSDNNDATKTRTRPGIVERMDSLAQQGYFKTDDRFYYTKLIYKAGQLTLNGQLFSPVQANKSSSIGNTVKGKEQPDSGG
ncbi:MAG: DUF945 domain-containing protein [Gammaproteobacteria bacterium]|nr:MAG: DUF945 domain-containing protein [Gammaproteobacteria bacterium]